MTTEMTLCDARRLPRAKAGPGRWRDFEATGCRAVAAFPVAQALPYAFDLDAREMVFSLHDDPRVLLAEPFIYTAQRNDLHRIGRIGFDRLDAVYGAAPPAVPPILVFSIGRTGSTLFNRLLACAVVWSVSEPDTISQLALSGDDFTGLATEQRRFLTWHALSPYLALAGSGVCAVKFRSQINAIAGEVALAFPTARHVFMLRGLENWALSTYRTFGIKPVHVAARLKEGLQAIAVLKAAGVTLEIVHYEQVIADPEATLGRIVGPGLQAGPDLSAEIAGVMSKDSQAGTRLERAGVKAAPEGEADWLARFLHLWREVRPAGVIADLQLDY